MSSGSSVKKRIRPGRRTLSGRFSILRFRSDSITRVPEPGELPSAGRMLPPSPTLILSLLPSRARVFDGIRQTLQTFSLKDGAEFTQQRRMNKTIRRNGFPAVQLESSPSEITHHSAGLLYQQHAGCGIPGIEIEFPESIKPSARNVTEIECC